MSSSLSDPVSLPNVLLPQHWPRQSYASTSKRPAIAHTVTSATLHTAKAIYVRVLVSPRTSPSHVPTLCDPTTRLVSTQRAATFATLAKRCEGWARAPRTSTMTMSTKWQSRTSFLAVPSRGACTFKCASPTCTTWTTIITMTTVFMILTD